MESSSHLSSEIPLHFVRRGDARRYILRVTPDRKVRVTVPRHGTFKEARSFVDRNRAWLEKQLRKQPSTWVHGSSLMFRGNLVQLEILRENEMCWARFDSLTLPIPPALPDYKPIIETHLQNLACQELPARTIELAALHSLEVRRVTIRNQRSRWGSCSVRKTISLNWRLVQTPFLVRDYIIIHELMHLREMNHSKKFWNHVAAACPDYLTAEKWLRKNSSALRG